MDDEEIEVIAVFKYDGSLKADDGNCNNDIRSLIGMGQEKKLDLIPVL